MKLFITEKEVFSFTLYMAEMKKGLIVSEKKKEIQKEEPDESKIVEHTFTFRRPTYRDNMTFLSETFVMDGQDEIKFDAMGARYARFVQLISSWSLTDEQGEAIPPTVKFIDQLNPSLANAVVDAMETFLS